MLYSDLRLDNNEILKVSRLCFGSLCIGPLQSNLSVRDGARIIKRAFDSGVNFIDTAQLYRTYPYIKAALELNAGKNKIIISTKTYAHTRELAKEALDEALRGLNIDCIDIFMLHEQESIHTVHGHIEALEYLFEQKRAGKIKAVGISTHCVAGVLGAVEFNRTYKKDKLSVIHPMFNITGLGIIPDKSQEQSAIIQMEAALIQAKKSGFFIFSMKPLGGGNLFARAEEALGFVTGKDFIDSVAVGMKSAAEADANARFFETGRFTDEYYRSYLINSGGKRLHIDYWCEACGKCAEACPSKALEISRGAARCDYNKCVLCGYCSGVCGCFVIKII